MNPQKKLNYLVVLMLVMFLSSCASLPSNFTPVEKAENVTMKGLRTAYDFRLFALGVANDFWRKGLLEEKEANEIAEMGDKFQDAINKASEALELYKKTAGGNQLDLDNKVEIYRKFYTLFNDLVLPLIIKQMEGD